MKTIIDLVVWDEETEGYINIYKHTTKNFILINEGFNDNGRFIQLMEFIE